MSNTVVLSKVFKRQICSSNKQYITWLDFLRYCESCFTFWFQLKNSLAVWVAPKVFNSKFMFFDLPFVHEVVSKPCAPPLWCDAVPFEWGHLCRPRSGLCRSTWRNASGRARSGTPAPDTPALVNHWWGCRSEIKELFNYLHSFRPFVTQVPPKIVIRTLAPHSF